MPKNKKNSNSPPMSPDLRFAFAPKTSEQKNMLKVIRDNFITFVIGPAGSGKSHVASAYALQMLFQKVYDKIIISRPLVTAGENLGWLPGFLDSKTKDYFVPIFAIMSKMLDRDTLKSLTNSNGTDAKIQILPLAFMRGHTFENTIVVADEFQNATVEQMRLLLTRIGDNCKIIVCGDMTQSDIGRMNGLKDAVFRFNDVAQQGKGIGIVKLTEKSIVRHPIIELIENVYKIK